VCFEIKNEKKILLLLIENPLIKYIYQTPPPSLAQTQQQKEKDRIVFKLTCLLLNASIT